MNFYSKNFIKESRKNIIFGLFKLLDIKYTEYYLRKALKSTVVSLQSIQKLLYTYKVNSLLVKLNTLQLIEIPYPAIAQIGEYEKKFVLLLKFEEDYITYLDYSVGIVKINTSDFEKLWSGITLLIEKTENSAEPNYAENRKQELLNSLRLPALLGVLLLVLLGGLWHLPVGVSWAWVATKLVGTVASVLLLWQSIDKNSVVAQFCSFNKKTDCNSLLTSPAAMVFGLFSWAEVGFAYFSAGLLLVLLSSTQNFIPFVGLLSLVTLPFTLWSVWYQWKIAKIWCPLCLVVVAVLWGEAMLSLFILSGGIIDTTLATPSLWGRVGVGLILALLPTVVYAWAKPFITKSQTLPRTTQALAHFKYNTDIFKFLLHQERQIDESKLPKDLVLGTAEAPLTLVFVSNTECPPCKQAQPKIESLLAHFPDELKVVMVYAHSKNVPNVDIQVHQTWCNNNQISHTPTFFFMGHELPQQYTIEDLHEFIGELVEEIA